MVGGRRLPVCTQEYAYVVQRAEVIVVNGFKSQFVQSLYFLTVVHDVSKAEERSPLQFTFGSLNGCGYTEAESRIIINRYNHFYSWQLTVYN